MTQCRVIPAAVSIEDFAYEAVEAYTECAVLHKQCSAAITERYIKEK